MAMISGGGILSSSQCIVDGFQEDIRAFDGKPPVIVWQLPIPVQGFNRWQGRTMTLGRTHDAR
ncbi:MAG: hypothetical protein ACRCTD_12230 [Beijerinckiaceae bacterium]